MIQRTAIIGALIAITLSSAAIAQETPVIDQEALIEQILATDHRQWDQIHDVVFEAEYLEGKMDNGTFKQEARYIKKIYIKYLEDTTLYRERYLEYYKDGELQSIEERDKKAREKRKEAQKRKMRNISYPMLEPFYPENREDYTVSYVGIEDAEDTTCYVFRVESLVEDDEHIDGTYYFETDGFHLVRVDFAPAKLVKKAMFKLSRLDMSVTYGPTVEGFWLPEQFEIYGKGKAAFLFGVNFAGIEYYTNPQVNVGLPDELFYETIDEETSEESDDG
jgi:hypothetical protein